MVLVLSQLASAQGVPNHIAFRTPWELYQSLSAQGLASSVVLPIGMSANGNPAIQTGDADLVLGTAVQYQSNVQIGGMQYDPLWIVPMSIGVRYRYKSLTLGSACSKTTVFRFDEVLPNSGLDDSIVHFVEEADASAYAFSLSCGLPTSSKSSLGIQYEISQAHYRSLAEDETEKWFDGSGSEKSSRWRVGFVTSARFHNDQKLTVGCYYSTKLDLLSQIQYKGSQIRSLELVDMSNPATIDAGVGLSHGTHVYAMNVTIPFSSGLQHAEADRLQFSGSVNFNALPTVSYMAGFWTNVTQSKPESRSYQRKMDAVYLVGGVTIRKSALLIDLVVADSHLTNQDLQRQTVIKLAVGVRM
ncbi:MAG: hypothetical protein KDC10_13775 [Calditrichaeota bacterium]|nr:hypothetical protein [Calditrichota bacterium]